MKTFKDYYMFREASRWKDSNWTPLPKKITDILKLYKGDKYFCSFSFMKDKIGVNPRAEYSGEESSSTPYGIYAYPVSYILQVGIENVPFAGDRPYFWIFTPKHPRRIKKIYSRSDKNAMLWEKAKGASHTLGLFHDFFLRRNIEGFVDYDTSTIHPSEPTQAVFFGLQTINPINVFENSYSKHLDKRLNKKIRNNYSASKKISPPILPTSPVVTKPKIDNSNKTILVKQLEEIEKDLGVIDYNIDYNWQLGSKERSNLNARKQELLNKKKELEQELGKIQ